MQSSLPEQLLKHAAGSGPPMPMLLRGSRALAARPGGSRGGERGLGDRVRARSRDEGAGVALPQHAGRGIDRPNRVSLRRQLGLAQDAPVILYSGTFETYQGLDDLIAAIPAVLAAVPKARFVLVGADRAAGTRSATGPRS